MKNIFKALNVTSEKELDLLVESLNLDTNQYIDFMCGLNNDCSPTFIRQQVLTKTINYGNGSYEKLKEQFSKKPFKRELKENNNVLPSGTYNIIVSNIEVDDYEEGEYNIHGEKELTINHDISNDLDEEIKEAILEDMGEPINGSIEVINYDYQIVDKNNKENLEEDTVYDHSWYEVKKQKYPKRTKDGVVIKEGIKDLFKKDNRQYRIEMDSNGAYLSKDKKHIVGDKNDALIVTGYKKASKIAKWLNKFEGTTIFHPVEVEKGNYPKSIKDGVVIKEGKSDDYTIHCIVHDLKKNNKNLKFDGNTKNLLKLMNQISKEYEVDDYISNKVVCELFGLNYSKFKLLKEALEDEEVKNDTTEVKEPKQKSSADPEITKFINTTNSVVDNTTNADILKGIIDSIDMKLAMVTDIEQSNQLGELKQKAETKMVSAKGIKAITENFHQDAHCDERDIEIISYVRDNFTPYIKSVGDVNVQEAYIDVLIGDKKSSFDAWMYASLSNGDLDIGWNQDIFYMNDRDDRQRKYIQEEVEDTARECVEEFLFEKKYVQYGDDGYIWNKEWTDDPEDDGSEWLEESVQGYVTFDNDAISLVVKVHDIDWDYGDEFDYDSQEEYMDVRDNLPATTFIERYSLTKNEILKELLGNSDDDIVSTVMGLLEMEVEYTLHNRFNWGTNSWDMTLMSPTQRIIDIVREWIGKAEKDNIEPESSGEEFDESYLSESNEDNSWLDNAKFKMDQKLVDSKGDIWYIDNVIYSKIEKEYSYPIVNVNNPEYMLLYPEDELMRDFTLYNEEPESTGEEFDESYDPSIDESNFEVGDKVQFKWGEKTLEGSIVKISYVGKNSYYQVSVYNPTTNKVENYVKVDPVSNEMKEIIREENIEETCSAGATCAANVSGFAKNIGKVAKRKKTSESFDVKLFKESILNDLPCTSRINEHILNFFENNGKFYMSVDNSLVKSYDKNVMIESVDEVVNNTLHNIELLENYSCCEMDILMETIEDKDIKSEDENRNQELLGTND